jgi:hypothetical protein
MDIEEKATTRYAKGKLGKWAEVISASAVSYFCF